MGGINNIDVSDVLISKSIVDGLNSSGRSLSRLSNVMEGAVPIIILFTIGMMMLTRKTLLTQTFGVILICVGITLSLVMFKNSRGF